MVSKPLRTAVLNVKALWHYYLNNLALDLGIRAGRRDYTRFIILGRSRIGSTLLRGLLNVHSRMVVFSEIFRNRHSIAWKVPHYPQSPGLLKLLQNNPGGFLEHKLFRTFPAYIRAVGFKIFYYHAQDPGWQPVWTYLKDNKDIKVIHLKRQNILRSHLSRQKAERTKIWGNRSGIPKGAQVTLPLDYEGCLKAFTETRAWEVSHDRLFAAHPMLEVQYETLSADYRGQIRCIQDFLGVERENVKPLTYKQSQLPLCQEIDNYQELKGRFKGTEWEYLFQDDA